MLAVCLSLSRSTLDQLGVYFFYLLAGATKEHTGPRIRAIGHKSHEMALRTTYLLIESY